MNTKTFENLFIWKESKNIFIEIYKIVTKSDFKDYFFKDQILRATLSISNNIAEGYERETKKEFVRFLYISKGSCGEIRNMLIIGQELGYFKEEDFNNFSIVLYKISGGIQKLIKNNKVDLD